MLCQVNWPLAHEGDNLLQKYLYISQLCMCAVFVSVLFYWSTSPTFGVLRKRGVNWETIVSIILACGQLSGAFSWLMINVRGITLGSVVLRSVRVCSWASQGGELFQGLCLRLLPSFLRDGVWPGAVSWNKPFPPQAASGPGVYHSSRSKVTAVLMYKVKINFLSFPLQWSTRSWYLGLSYPRNVGVLALTAIGFVSVFPSLIKNTGGTLVKRITDGHTTFINIIISSYNNADVATF